MAPTRRGKHSDAEPPPPPSMAEVLMAIEENRLRNERLLEQLVQQGARRNNDYNTLTEFLRSQPPTFSGLNLELLPLSSSKLKKTPNREVSKLHRLFLSRGSISVSH